MVAGSDDEPSAPDAVVVDGDASGGGTPPPRRAGRMFRRPPGLVFHAVLVVALLLVLDAWSGPGVQLLLVVLLLYLCGATVLVWLVRLATFGWAGAHGRAEGRARRFLVAPIAGVLFLALLYTSVPLRFRWFVSRDDFESALDLAPPPTSKRRVVTFELPDRIGSYDIRLAQRQGDAVIFYDDVGSGLVDEAGFAYFPTGPFPELSGVVFENPQFRSLGGHWYAWTASW